MTDARPAKVIPPWLKLAYTAFVAVLVPYYWWAYGPANFLYFCDVALLLTVVALWTENRLLTSMQAVGIVLPQMLWVADFLAQGVSGRPLTGLAAYMFDADIPLFVRALSSFHGWLPFLLLWMIWKLGYDRRALLWQTLLCVLILLGSYFLAPPPPAPAENPNAAINVNYAYGLTNDAPQTRFHPAVYLGLLMLAFPLGLYVPGHLALIALDRRWARHRPATDQSIASEVMAAATTSDQLPNAAGPN